MKRYSNEFKKAAIERVRNGETQLPLQKVLESAIKRSIIGVLKLKKNLSLPSFQ